MQLLSLTVHRVGVMKTMLILHYLWMDEIDTEIKIKEYMNQQINELTVGKRCTMSDHEDNDNKKHYKPKTSDQMSETTPHRTQGSNRTPG